MIANQAAYLGGIIDVEARRRARSSSATATDYGIPMVVLVDTPGFMPGTRQEGLGVIRHGAELVRAFAASTSPRATVILRKAFGGAFITMNSKGLGADAHSAGRAPKIGVMGASGAVEIIHRRALMEADGDAELAEQLAQTYTEQHLSAQAALELRCDRRGDRAGRDPRPGRGGAVRPLGGRAAPVRAHPVAGLDRGKGPFGP